MRILVIGTGKVGSLLIEQLAQEGHQIVAIDQDEKTLMDVQNSLDVLCFSGNAVDRSVLTEAGVSFADLVIAATDSDEVNMLCCLLARKLGASHTIARVRKHELADEIGLFSEDMGLSMTINPELYAAQEIFSLLRFTGLMSVEAFGHGLFEMIEFRLAEDGPATSMPLKELATKYKSKALVCAIRRNGTTIIPDGSVTLMKHDYICFAAEPNEAEHFLKLCGIRRRIPKHVIIIGAGQITYYLVRLMRQAGMQPVVIENNPAKAEAAIRMYGPGQLVLIAGGKDAGMDIRSLTETAADICTGVAIFGPAGPRYSEGFREASKKEGAVLKDIFPAASLEEAFHAAVKMASPGQTILLSPGDKWAPEFKSVYEEGELFEKLVEQLKIKERNGTDQR